MRKPVILLLFLIISISPKVFAQVADSTNFSIYHSSPRKYVIADVQVSGIKYLYKTVLIQLSGLVVGQEVEILGETINLTIK